MAIVDMQRDEFGKTGDTGSIYNTSLEITSGESDIYLLPTSRIYAIACRQENGVLYFTMDDDEVIDAGNEEWTAWDGVSLINLGVTAFKFVWSSGTAKAVVSVKTEKI